MWCVRGGEMVGTCVCGGEMVGTCVCVSGVCAWG